MGNCIYGTGFEAGNLLSRFRNALAINVKIRKMYEHSCVTYNEIVQMGKNTRIIGVFSVLLTSYNKKRYRIIAIFGSEKNPTFGILTLKSTELR